MDEIKEYRSKFSGSEIDDRLTKVAENEAKLTELESELSKTNCGLPNVRLMQDGNEGYFEGTVVCTDYIPAEYGQEVVWKYADSSAEKGYNIYLLEYDENKQYINGGYWSANTKGGIRTLNVYSSGAKYIRATFIIEGSEDRYLQVEGVRWNIYPLSGRVVSMIEKNEVAIARKTPFAGYLLPHKKVEIKQIQDEDGAGYVVSVVIPIDTSFYCGKKTFYTTSDISVSLRFDFKVNVGYVLVNLETETFRIIRWNGAIADNEYIFFAFNIEAQIATLDPYSYTVNGKSNTEIEYASDMGNSDDVAMSQKAVSKMLGGIFFMADSLPNIDESNGVMVFPECQFLIGNTWYYFENGYTIDLNGVNTSTWKTILLNTATKEMEVSAWNIAKPNSHIRIGGFTTEETGTTSVGKIKESFFPFPITINGIKVGGNATDIADLKIGKRGTSIFENNDYSRMQNLFVQSNWATRNASGVAQQPRLTLCHFSDIHGFKENYDRIVEFTSEFSSYIDDIICTGDIVLNSSDNDFSFWTNQNIMAVIGNHDTATYDNGVFDWTGFGRLNSYNRYFKPFIQSWGVTQPADADELGLMYYYKDYTDSKVRLVVLDCMFWDDAQNTWLAEILEDAKSKGLSVISAIHYPKGMDNFKTPFCSLYPDSNNYLMQQPIDTMQAFINSGGEFITWLCGHTHIDFMGVVKNTSQLMIVVESSHVIDTWNDSDRIVGTKSQDSFNILSVDTYDKTLTIFRVGNDTDKWLRKKETICIDYAKNEILYT